jgi:hypothetical protein
LRHGDFHPDHVLMTSKGPLVIDGLTAPRFNEGFPTNVRLCLRLLAKGLCSMADDERLHFEP